MSTVEQIENIPLTEIISGLKPKRISLDWDGDRGFAKIEEMLMYDGDNVSVEYSAEVHAIGQTEKSTYDYPGSFEIVDTDIWTSGIVVRDENGEAMQMTDAEYDLLEGRLMDSLIVE